ncbi:MAG: head decoration protein [Candidatus Thorarchaeota archaeon]
MVLPASNQQLRSDVNNTAVLLRGSAVTKENEVVAQDGAHTGVVKKWTVMAQIGSTAKWVPYTDAAATDGSQFPSGVLLKEISEADIQAGDVNAPVMVGDAVLAESGLTVESPGDLDTVISVPINFGATGYTVLRWAGIYLESTTIITQPENQ